MFILNRLIINRLIDQILMLQVAINFSGYADTWIRSQFYIIKRSKMVSGNSHDFKSCSHKFSSLRADLRLSAARRLQFFWIRGYTVRNS